MSVPLRYEMNRIDSVLTVISTCSGSYDDQDDDDLLPKLNITKATGSNTGTPGTSTKSPSVGLSFKLGHPWQASSNENDCYDGQYRLGITEDEDLLPTHHLTKSTAFTTPGTSAKSPRVTSSTGKLYQTKRPGSELSHVLWDSKANVSSPHLHSILNKSNASPLVLTSPIKIQVQKEPTPEITERMRSVKSFNRMTVLRSSESRSDLSSSLNILRSAKSKSELSSSLSSSLNILRPAESKPDLSSSLSSNSIILQSNESKPDPSSAMTISQSDTAKLELRPSDSLWMLHPVKSKSDLSRNKSLSSSPSPLSTFQSRPRMAHENKKQAKFKQEKIASSINKRSFQLSAVTQTNNCLDQDDDRSSSDDHQSKEEQVLVSANVPNPHSFPVHEKNASSNVHRVDRPDQVTCGQHKIDCNENI